MNWAADSFPRRESPRCSSPRLASAGTSAAMDGDHEVLACEEVDRFQAELVLADDRDDRQMHVARVEPQPRPLRLVSEVREGLRLPVGGCAEALEIGLVRRLDVDPQDLVVADLRQRVVLEVDRAILARGVEEARLMGTISRARRPAGWLPPGPPW